MKDPNKYKRLWKLIQQTSDKFKNKIFGTKNNKARYKTTNAGFLKNKKFNMGDFTKKNFSQRIKPVDLSKAFEQQPVRFKYPSTSEKIIGTIKSNPFLNKMSKAGNWMRNNPAKTAISIGTAGAVDEIIQNKKRKKKNIKKKKK